MAITSIIIYNTLFWMKFDSGFKKHHIINKMHLTYITNTLHFIEFDRVKTILQG